MSTKIALQNLLDYSKDLENKHPNETAYWHLQKLRNEIERVKILDLHIVSNAERTVCDDCKHKGTSKWLDPCHTCREGDLKEQTDC